MKLFFYKPKVFNPLLFIVTRISSDQEFEKVESWTQEIFQILMDQNEALEKNILIFSIIKEHEKKTINLILPSTKSSKTLTNRCHKNTKFLNSVIIQTLINNDCEFYIDLMDEKVAIHYIKLNLMALSKFYSIN